jgi:hypothetical protein
MYLSTTTQYLTRFSIINHMQNNFRTKAYLKMYDKYTMGYFPNIEIDISHQRRPA